MTTVPLGVDKMRTGDDAQRTGGGANRIKIERHFDICALGMKTIGMPPRFARVVVAIRVEVIEIIAEQRLGGAHDHGMIEQGGELFALVDEGNDGGSFGS